MERMTPLRLRARVRRLPAGELIVRSVVFLLGAAFIVLGIVLVVLPGPLTIPPILVGLAIWSLEFDFAKSLLDRASGEAQRAWDQAKLHPWRTAAVTGSGLALLVVGLVLVARFELLDRAVALFT